MPSRKEYNRLVNKKWPAEMDIPSDQEAIAGAKLLYRRATGRAFKGKVKITRGNRYTWTYRGELRVNPDRPHGHVRGGWPSIVHLISHLAHNAHGEKQLAIECDLTNYCLEKGFLTGSLRRAPRKKKDVVIVRAERVDKRLKAWETKQKRATTAIRKLRAQKRYYDKKLA